MANLETTYLGLKLKNPLVAASSGLTGSLEKIKELSEAGIGAIVLKSIFEEQINNEVGAMLSDGAQNVDYAEAEVYIANYLRDHSITKQTKLVTQAKQATDVPIIASVNCIAGDEWTSFAQDLESAGADAIEMNIFYLPVNRNESADKVEQLYTKVVHSVKSKIKIPLSVKIGSHFSNIVGMAEKLKAHGASGLVIFNRFYEPDINLEKLELTASEVFSTPQELRHGLRWTGLVSSHVPNLELAATTGIHDADAVLKQLLAGAQVTQLCSTLYIHGIPVVGKILEDMKTFMHKWNFRRIEDFRGRLSYKNLTDPMMYERSQFMKYYSGRK